MRRSSIHRCQAGQLLFLCGLLLLMACYRGRPSEKPPIHLIPDMDSQPKFVGQELNPFFADHRAMRLPVDGTVSRDSLRSIEMLSGSSANGKLVAQAPVPVTLPGLHKGRQRYNIYCSPCHSQVGDGQGVMIKRGYIPPPSFHNDRLRQMPDGHFFDVISNGIRNMPSYRHQIPLRDRWLITNYLRALQKSQYATIDDVPEEKRDLLP